MDESTQQRLASADNQVKLLGSPSETLIHAYFAELHCNYAAEQKSSHGILTVKAELALEVGHLRISVLNGRDLQPHPTKMGKLPDTYVEVQPVFSQPSATGRIKSLKTKTQYKNAFPLYDETFTV